MMRSLILILSMTFVVGCSSFNVSVGMDQRIRSYDNDEEIETARGRAGNVRGCNHHSGAATLLSGKTDERCVVSISDARNSLTFPEEGFGPLGNVRLGDDNPASN